MATKNILYAAVGAGDLALETARKTRDRIDVKEFPKLGKELPRRVTELQSDARKVAKKWVTKGNKQYDLLAARGQKVVRSARNSAKTKRAVEQTKTAKTQTKAAKTQTKAAATSTKKAAAATVDAANSAAGSL